jgi:hypothetical protein
LGLGAGSFVAEDGEKKGEWGNCRRRFAMLQHFESSLSPSYLFVISMSCNLRVMELVSCKYIILKSKGFSYMDYIISKDMCHSHRIY